MVKFCLTACHQLQHSHLACLCNYRQLVLFKQCATEYLVNRCPLKSLLYFSLALRQTISAILFFTVTIFFFIFNWNNPTVAENGKLKTPVVHWTSILVPRIWLRMVTVREVWIVWKPLLLRFLNITVFIALDWQSVLKYFVTLADIHIFPVDSDLPAVYAVNCSLSKRHAGTPCFTRG
jgi:hypothetical protein